jgi:threonine aldolase
MLKSYQGVLSVETGHINVHESGAIEFGGHKVLALPTHDGKMDAAELDQWLHDFYADIAYEHMVFPGMVYITFATEMGTIYTLAELQAISAVCKRYELPLFIDGARLGYGLMAEGCDVTLEQLAGLCDVFYLGGTKCGALCGEAVVFPNHNAPAHFFTMVKQHGALLAKGRLLGIQFDVLMQDGLYFKIARHAVEQAIRLRDAFVAKGYKMYSNSPTNQQFVLLDKDTIERLEKDFVFEQWFPVGNMMNCRFVTSWATRSEDVDALIAAL